MTISPEELPRKRVISKRAEAKERIKELILRGKLAGEGYIPSVRKTAELIGLNRDAVWRAYCDLENERFIQLLEVYRWEHQIAHSQNNFKEIEHVYSNGTMRNMALFLGSNLGQSQR